MFQLTCSCSDADDQRVCSAVKDEFAPKEQLPYLPDTNFVMCSYAVSRLLTNAIQS